MLRATKENLNRFFQNPIEYLLGIGPEHHSHYAHLQYVAEESVGVENENGETSDTTQNESTKSQEPKRTVLESIGFGLEGLVVSKSSPMHYRYIQFVAEESSNQKIVNNTSAEVDKKPSNENAEIKHRIGG